MLSWEVQTCTSAEIDQGIGDVSGTGSIEVSPSETTTYTLKAFYKEYNYEAKAYVGGGAEKQCTVTVEN